MTNLNIACLALALIAFPLNASQADQVKGTAPYLQRMADLSVGPFEMRLHHSERDGSWWPYPGARWNGCRTIDSRGASVVERALAEHRNAIHRQ